MPVGPLSQPGGSARLPNAPTSISATAVSGGQATVSFAESTNPGKPSGNYVATSSPSSITGTSASSPISITGLAVGTAFTFTVVKQSGSGISSVSSSASNSIGAFTTPTFGTQSGTSTATAPSASSVGVSNVYNTTATLTRSVGANATFLDYERVTGSGGSSNSSSDSLVGLSENNTQEWRIRTTNTFSTFALTTSVNPQGSTTTVSVEFGNNDSYGSSAGSVNIGAGAGLVSSNFNLSSSSAATVFFRITATNAVGASVQTTGTITRTVDTYNGSTTGPFVTYISQTVSGPKSVSKQSYHADIQINSYALVGGGGGGGNQAGANLGFGGGGGGNVQTGSNIPTTSFALSGAGVGGQKEQAGAASSLSGASFATIDAIGGFGGSGNLQGGSSGNGNGGHAGASTFIGGGGGGVSAAASDINGGSGNGSQGPGGPGFFNNGFGSFGFGVYINGSAGSAGAGGASNSVGTNGLAEINYVGPA